LAKRLFFLLLPYLPLATELSLLPLPLKTEPFYILLPRLHLATKLYFFLLADLPLSFNRIPFALLLLG